MAIAAGILWTATRQRGDGLRHVGWGLAAVAAGTLGVLMTRWDRPVLGSVVTGGAALVLGFVVVRWIWDRRRFVEAATEVAAADGPGPTLLLRTAAGRVHRLAADDVRWVTVTCVVLSTSPDDGPAERRDRISFFPKVRLHIGVLGGEYSSRPMLYVDSEEPARLVAEWQRLCPGARVTRENRFTSTGTGD